MTALQMLRPRLGVLNTARMPTLASAQSWRTKEQTAAQRGYGYRWQKARIQFLSSHPLCVACQADGRVTAATVVDHIEPHRGDQTKFWDEANWQPLCASCHGRKTVAEGGQPLGYSIYRPDWIAVPRVPVVIVCGPPGSGKSTYVAQHAQPGDMVLDLDVMASRISGRPIYMHDSKDRDAAIMERNRLLDGLSRPGCDIAKCWLIVTGEKVSQRLWWKQKLNAELVVMSTPKEECRRRIEDDGRRPAQVKSRHLQSLAAWQTGDGGVNP